MRLENKTLMDFRKPIDAKPSSQGMESIMSRLAIVGDEPVEIVLFQCLGQLPICQDAFSDLENPGEYERGSITPGAYPDVTLDDRVDACRINGGKIVDEIFLLRCKTVDVPGKSWERKLEINYGLCSLCSMMVFNNTKKHKAIDLKIESFNLYGFQRTGKGIFLGVT